MEIFRLAREKYCSPLSGKGAAFYGGRWNSPGVELIYCAQNRSLAMAEVAVHFSLASIPSDYFMMTIWVPDAIPVEPLHPKHLPVDWNIFPPPHALRIIGDQFVRKGENLLLQVPSAVTPGDHNILINPAHPAFEEVRVLRTEPFAFDRRLFRQVR